jgi:hypothetical protein
MVDEKAFGGWCDLFECGNEGIMDASKNLARPMIIQEFSESSGL